MFANRQYKSHYPDLKYKPKDTLSSVYGRCFGYSEYLDYSKISTPKIFNFPPYIEPSYLKHIELKLPINCKIVVEVPLFMYSQCERNLRSLFYSK